MKLSLVILIHLLLIGNWLLSQPSNFCIIENTDSHAEIIRKSAQVVPSERQYRWQLLELTAFFHFGINTFTNNEWGSGTEDPALFNPLELDARQWIRVVKAAGIKQVILTAKHHDGFCLWPSRYTSHSVISSPWKQGKGDVVREVAEACKEYEIGFGVYLSPWDRNHPSYGSDGYNDYFVNQLTELLTQYGKIDEVWFDGASGEGKNGRRQVYDFPRYYQVIRELQPDAVIAIMGPDVRWVGTESGYGRNTEWSVVPADRMDISEIEFNSQKEVLFKPQADLMDDDLGSREMIYKAKSLVWYPAETDVSIRPGWFFHESENNLVKSPEQLLDIYYNSVGKNGVLLLNIPPDRRGLLHESDVQSLLEWKRLLDNTFSDNFFQKAIISSPNGSGASALVDGDYSTCWTTRDADTTAIIELVMPEPATFDLILLQENIRKGQRIEEFLIQYRVGDEWIALTSGTTAGYKRLLQFKPVTATAVRININSSRLNPTLSEVGIFKAALVD